MRHEPVRVAVVEIGTRSLRLLIADVRDGDVRSVLRRHAPEVMMPVELTPESAHRWLREAIPEIQGYLRQARQQGVDAEKLHIVGTQALRRLVATAPDALATLEQELAASSPNGAPPVRVLTHEEEGRTAFVAAATSLPKVVAGGVRVLVVDQGTGSTELAVGRWVNRRETLESCTGLPLGTGILQKKYAELESDTPRLHAYCTEELKRMDVVSGVERVIGLGGAATQLGWLAAGGRATGRYSRDKIHGRTLPLADFQKGLMGPHGGALMDKLLAASHVGIHDRSRLIAGMVAHLALLEHVGVDAMTVCAEALRVGLAAIVARGADAPRGGPART